ncbi:ATP-dependent 6-phosphofructokinase [Ignavibacteria bacterium]|nr:6-phosphofructokinase [Bacteroidota bacterium]MCZ2133679.1 6-phosphofructokinase [Bacteroidota bacterium]
MKIAILTGGGDCPGMNAFVRAVVRCSLNMRPETDVWGVTDGWKGLINNDYRRLNKRDVAGLGSAGGTVLGTVRVPELAARVDLQEKIARNLHENHFDYLFMCGGNGSIKAANVIETILRREDMMTRIVAAPGSIDNDVCNNIGLSIGFYSALDKSLEMLGWIRDTASSHRRVYLVKSMGRKSAYLAFYAGIATGAEYVIQPGENIDFEKLAVLIGERDRDTRIIVSEGYDALTLTEIRETLENIFGQRNLTHEIRTVDMGYFQRGGKAAVTDILRASWVAFRMVKDAFRNCESGFYTASYIGDSPEVLPLYIAADDAITSHDDIPPEVVEMALALR